MRPCPRPRARQGAQMCPPAAGPGTGVVAAVLRLA